METMPLIVVLVIGFTVLQAKVYLLPASSLRMDSPGQMSPTTELNAQCRVKSTTRTKKT